ncbi:hypothetical protein B0H17DRAFT_1136378 [Mycena rosella]|uniref:Uncharacterized protein n=1 Tax=Mycena rosella TaxID=1033263 RepID=A0AAD7DCK4_MYCRO|nr:hypothetical protein B0H17DRAFT_1136378 [Mycena rosella]
MGKQRTTSKQEIGEREDASPRAAAKALKACQPRRSHKGAAGIQQGELDAARALADMLRQKRRARIAARLTSPLPPSSEQESDLQRSESRAYVRRPIARGERMNEDESENDGGDEREGPQDQVDATRRSVHHKSSQQRDRRPQALRMCTPPSSSPPAEELEVRIPSFYKRLWAAADRG